MKQMQFDVIYGIHPVRELLKARRRRVFSLYVAKPTPSPVQDLIRQATQDAKIVYVDRRKLDLLAQSSDHQGIVAQAAPFAYTRKFFAPDEHPLILLLDSIHDVRNLGALLRSAYCTNISGVVLGEKGTSDLSAAAYKASAGLAEYMHIFKAPSAIAGAQMAQKNGYTIYSGAFGGVPLDEVSFASPACIVIGNEGAGVQRKIIELGHKVTIPQVRADVSYNASVAGALMMFYAARRCGVLA